jgi:hypothetical protein
VGTKTGSQKWDTSFTVPVSVIDSISLQVENIHALYQTSGDSVLMRYAKAYMQQMKLADDSGLLACRYTLELANQESVLIDSSGRIVTRNVQLNLFLDSLHVSGDKIYWRSASRWKKGKTIADHWVLTDPSQRYLNLHYINRRLNELAPGSHMKIFFENTEIAPEVFYVPQGERNISGDAPVTLVAIAGGGTWFDLPVGRNANVQVDGRTFLLFCIYGDGEVEFMRYTYKEALRMEYRTEKNGAPATKRRR